MFEFLYLRILRIYPSYLFTALIFVFAVILLPDKNLNLTLIFETIFLILVDLVLRICRLTLFMR